MIAFTKHEAAVPHTTFPVMTPEGDDGRIEGVPACRRIALYAMTLLRPAVHPATLMAESLLFKTVLFTIQTFC